ncbi:DUF3108 domain-containing protein [Thiomicrorhabdus sp. zzn3]|uniref:DUF3108 domain-containing protein n=1 Tax=Thiomicrorhabdus sp. zzn3 TaxID=3039775 RepID=UPI0024364CB5|nr:DUF3108 domain-containing protein [Thiomicrorhabdus sp. zzn3]MDG6777713.1 DUF3108 domain-containing protein [Thiomicrorhabdus sp. zzn3]
MHLPSLFRHIQLTLMAVSILALPDYAFAKPLPQFQARFEVDAFGIKLGTSEQELKCIEAHCTLTATAKPSGLASLFVNEQTEEIIHLQQSDTDFIWQSYQKTTFKKGNVSKTVRFIATDDNQVHYVEKDRFWPHNPNVFDMVSIAYALQFYLLNQKPLTGFHLQDTGSQDAVTIQALNGKSRIDLADMETTVEAQGLAFETPKAKIKIWLLPAYDYFPGRIEVYNIEKDKTITLLLEEPPKTL